MKISENLRFSAVFCGFLQFSGGIEVKFSLEMCEDRKKNSLIEENKQDLRDHSFSTFRKFSKKRTFLNP